MGEWQPKATAPRDGSWFLTFVPDDDRSINYDFAYWDEEIALFCKMGCGWQYVTHWMPLPQPPEAP